MVIIYRLIKSPSYTSGKAVAVLYPGFVCTDNKTYIKNVDYLWYSSCSDVFKQDFSSVLATTDQLVPVSTVEKYSMIIIRQVIVCLYCS